MFSTAACRRLIASAGVLALGVAGLAADGHGQAMQPATFIVVNNLFSTPGYVAAENGYWAKQGLNVNVKLTSSGRAVVQAVQAGDAQIVLVTHGRPVVNPGDKIGLAVDPAMVHVFDQKTGARIAS